MRCYKIRDRGQSGSRTRYCVELYNFYPEEGPKGTPGRGPYCINWVDIRAADYHKAVAQLAAQGATPLPIDATSGGAA